MLGRLLNSRLKRRLGIGIASVTLGLNSSGCPPSARFETEDNGSTIETIEDVIEEAIEEVTDDDPIVDWDGKRPRPDGSISERDCLRAREILYEFNEELQYGNKHAVEVAHGLYQEDPLRSLSFLLDIYVLNTTGLINVAEAAEWMVRGLDEILPCTLYESDDSGSGNPCLEEIAAGTISIQNTSRDHIRIYVAHKFDRTFDFYWEGHLVRDDNDPFFPSFELYGRDECDRLDFKPAGGANVGDDWRFIVTDPNVYDGNSDFFGDKVLAERGCNVGNKNVLIFEWDGSRASCQGFSSDGGSGGGGSGGGDDSGGTTGDPYADALGAYREAKDPGNILGSPDRVYTWLGLDEGRRISCTFVDNAPKIGSGNDFVIYVGHWVSTTWPLDVTIKSDTGTFNHTYDVSPPNRQLGIDVGQTNLGNNVEVILEAPSVAAKIDAVEAKH